MAVLNPLIIIPARGGSKGIPHKNIKPLCGKPLLLYSIEAARAVCTDLSRIILSTDDPQIADVARDAGLPVPYMRPAELATDTAGSREMMLDAMEWADRQGITYDAVVLLQPTSPFRTATHISEAMQLFRPDIDMVVSVTEAASNPYYTCFETDGTPDGFLHISKGNGLYTRRQDCPPVWEYNGAVYVINPESLRRQPLGAFARRLPYPMSREDSTDLDTPLDWLVAEAIMSNRNQSDL
ncbi:MAG: cytidylyltransferase domain-containing protein [Muribaculaceae bacterium]